MASPATAHVDPWTEQDLLALPEDGQRHELVEGRLLASPPPSGPHQVLALRLARLLDDAVPPALPTVEGLGVRVPGGSVLVPDLLVAEQEAVLQDRSGIPAPGAIRLVVEIVSPASATVDRLTKPALYARAGIAHLWRVEPRRGRSSSSGWARAGSTRSEGWPGGAARCRWTPPSRSASTRRRWTSDRTPSSAPPPVRDIGRRRVFAAREDRGPGSRAGRRPPSCVRPASWARRGTSPDTRRRMSTARAHPAAPSRMDDPLCYQLGRRGGLTGGCARARGAGGDGQDGLPGRPGQAPGTGAPLRRAGARRRRGQTEPRGPGRLGLRAGPPGRGGGAVRGRLPPRPPGAAAAGGGGAAEARGAAGGRRGRPRRGRAVGIGERARPAPAPAGGGLPGPQPAAAPGAAGDRRPSGGGARRPGGGRGPGRPTTVPGPGLPGRADRGGRGRASGHGARARRPPGRAKPGALALRPPRAGRDRAR